MKIVYGLGMLLCAASSISAANASKNDVEASHKRFQRKIYIDCSQNPLALKNITERSALLIMPTEFIVSGRCLGPLTFTKGDVVVRARDGQVAKLALEQEANAGVYVEHANVQLRNFNIELPTNVPAVIADKNSVVSIWAVTSNATNNTTEAFFPFQVKDNSTLTFYQQENIAVSVSGSSVAEFAQDNKQIVLNVLDTSYARSNKLNHFSSVQTSGNAYFLADNQTHIDVLMIWSKSAVDINNESSVGQLMMGGQTLFAAFRNSRISGPYGIYGNVVFELESSSAENWQTIDKPHAIFTGNNATVNGIFYPGWSWSGQDAAQE